MLLIGRTIFCHSEILPFALLIGQTIFCHSEILPFALLIGRTIMCHNEILSSVLLRLKSVSITFTVVFVNKSQYIWKKRKVDVIVMNC